MTRQAFLSFLPAAILVSISSGALANHCPYWYGSQCCWKQTPDPAWVRTPGGYNVCEFAPDNCHIRCYEEHNYLDGPQGLSKTKDARSQNAIQGSCENFADQIKSPGILQPTPDGSGALENVPGRAGYTRHNITWDPHWRSGNPTYSAEGAEAKACIKVTGLSVRFSWDMSQDVLRWFPPKVSSVTQACSDLYQAYLKAAMAHENAHAAAADSIAEYYSESFDQTAFTPTICANGATQAEALKAARDDVDLVVGSYLKDYFNNKIKPEMAAADSDVDAHYIIPPPCGQCP